MPIVDLINGIKIETHEHLGGEMPAKQLRVVYEWLADNQNYALTVFYELNQGLK